MAFYCQNLIGDANFSIKEWNEQYKICNDLGIKIPSEPKECCKEQCFECMAIIGERKKKTNDLINKQ